MAIQEETETVLALRSSLRYLLDAVEKDVPAPHTGTLADAVNRALDCLADSADEARLLVARIREDARRNPDSS